MLMEIRKLSKHYPGFTLSDISFSLNEGEIMGLIGKNGAGKSTALKSVLNMARPDGGSVCMFGMDYFEHEAACKPALYWEELTFTSIKSWPPSRLLHSGFMCGGMKRPTGNT